MFILHLDQSGGCDYTIACGQLLTTLKATTKADALAESARIIVGEYNPEHNCFEDGYRGERQLRTATLYEVASEERLDVITWYRESENLIKDAKERKKEAKEREEFERLRKKFGTPE